MSLNENMVLMKTKQTSLADVKNLNLWGAELEDISLCSQLPNLEVLALSVNHVSSLAEVATCKKMRELYLRKNDVADLRQLTYLSQMPRLTTLWLNDNPVARDPNYRLYCIKYAPSLTLLDTVEVTAAEKADAAKLAALEGLGGGGGPAPQGIARPPSGPSSRVPSSQNLSAPPQPPRESTPNNAPTHGRRQQSTEDVSPAPSSYNDDSQRAILTAVVTLLGELSPNSLGMLRQEIDARIASTRRR
eukprot:GILI01037725.1.p1 GENE.GILI01037725.1~~GILI01037725.1.p1  ORF type:complete len:246 (+),score=37.17 GILI01037725.1:50-787(+)